MANFLEIPIHENDIELPPAYLDYNAMVRHHFVERNDQFLQYRLIFDFQEKRRYLITREEANKYERRTEAARLQAVARQAVAATSQCDPSYNFGFPPGQP